MDQQTLIARVRAALEPDQRIRGLFVSGSFGRGTADAVSDVDLLAVVAQPDQEAVAEDWRGVFEGIVPVVYWNRLPWALVLNAITEQWLRCDLDIVGPDRLDGRTQDRLKVLIDRDGIFDKLPASLAPRGIDTAKLQGTTNEFIRILGLTPVAVARNEVELIGLGTGMLRRMLTELLVMEMNHADTGGMLHLTRLLDAERMELMAAIPVPERSVPSALDSQFAIARAFLPRARALYDRLGLAWPEKFEAAARNHLDRALGTSW